MSEGQRSSKEEEEEHLEGLPTAALVKDGKFRTDEFIPTFEMTEYGRKNCREDGDELVRREDHQRRIAEERSRKFEEGFFEGRDSMKEEFKALIQDKIDNLEEDIEEVRDCVKSDEQCEYDMTVKEHETEETLLLGRKSSLESLLDEVQQQ